MSQSRVGWLFTCFDVEDGRVVGYRQNRWDWSVFGEGEGGPSWIGLDGMVIFTHFQSKRNQPNFVLDRN